MKLKHVGRSLLGAIAVGLTLSAAISIGFLSFAGMYLLSPVLWLAIGSLVLAATIDSMVFYENIANGLRKIFSRDYLEMRLTEIEISEWLEREQPHDNTFLQNYENQRLYVQRLNAKAGLSSEDQIKQKRENKLLERMTRHVRDFIFYPENATNSLFINEFSHHLDNRVEEKRTQLLEKYRSKRFWSWFMAIPTAIAAVSCGIVTYFALIEGVNLILPLISGYSLTFAAYGLTLSTFMPIIIGISILAGVADFVVTLNTTMDLIHNDSLKKMFNRIIDRVSEGTFTSILYGLGALTLVAMGIFLTAATAATWWNTALLNFFTPAGVFFAVSTGFYALGVLTFNLENTHETLDSMEQKIEGFSFKEALLKIWNKITGSNIFRGLFELIILPARTLIFIGHCFSMGAIADNFVNRLFSATVGGTVEFFEDFEYVYGQEEGTDHHDQGHQHADIVGGLFKIILSPLLFLSALWNFSSGLVSGKGPSFRDALSEEFGFKQAAMIINENPIDERCIKQELIGRIEKQKQYCSNNGSDYTHDHEFLNNLSEALLSNANNKANLKRKTVAKKLHPEIQRSLNKWEKQYPQLITKVKPCA